MQVASTSAPSRVGMMSETRGAGSGVRGAARWTVRGGVRLARVRQQLGQMHDRARLCVAR